MLECFRMPSSWHWWLLLPIGLSWGYWIAVAVLLALFMRRRPPTPKASYRPSVSLIKPVCGLEKELFENLSTACLQDYPDYEVIFALQDPKDPALAVVQRVQGEHPDRRVSVIVDPSSAGPNGRLCNILNATRRAKGEALVFSDSDMRLAPDYLKRMVDGLADPRVGVVCTLYRARGATNLYESMELLSLNVEFVPSMAFAVTTGISLACPGASQALRRETLGRIGGLEPLAHCLVEDFELGRRAVDAGLEVRMLPYVAESGVDLRDFKAWWKHQVYWDQNTRAASPVGFFFTWLIRGVPLACLLCLLDAAQFFLVLPATVALRLTTAAASLRVLGDVEGLWKLWLLPLRDLAGVFVWLASFVQRKVYWKGRVFVLQGGRMVEAAAAR